MASVVREACRGELGARAGALSPVTRQSERGRQAWGEAFCALKTDLDPDGRTLRDLVFDRFLGKSQPLG